jgi:hypothetical protein
MRAQAATQQARGSQKVEKLDQILRNPEADRSPTQNFRFGASQAAQLEALQDQFAHGVGVEEGGRGAAPADQKHRHGLLKRKRTRRPTQQTNNLCR